MTEDLTLEYARRLAEAAEDILHHALADTLHAASLRVSRERAGHLQNAVRAFRHQDKL